MDPSGLLLPKYGMCDVVHEINFLSHHRCEKMGSVVVFGVEVWLINLGAPCGAESYEVTQR